MESTLTIEPNLFVRAVTLLSFAACLVTIACLIGVVLRHKRRVARIEREHAESDQRFRQIAEHIEEVFWVTDWPSRRVAYVSPAYRTIWGRSEQGLLDDEDDWIEPIHEDDKAEVQKLFAERVALGGFDVLYRIHRPSGTIRWIHDRGFPIHDDEGNVVRIVGIAQDVTKRKEAEDELRTSRERLGQLAARIEDVREEERARLSREFHDDLGQTLTGLRMDAAWLFEHVPPENDAARGRLREMIDHVDTALNEVRRISTSLRPSVLDDLGLLAAIEWQAQEFGRRCGCEYRLDLPPAPLDRSPRRDTAIFRILQEALTNAARHANATWVEIRLWTDEDAIHMVVEDDGRGVDEPVLATSKSLGVLGMRERAASIGGSLDVRRAGATGTRVTLRAPTTPPV